MKQYQDLPEVQFPHVRHERGRKVIYRDQFTRVSSYASGDGDLSFVVSDIRTTESVGTPTQAEAEQICPGEWRVYMNGPYPRAYKVGACNHEYGIFGICRKYTILRHVSRSGMTRGIDVYIMDKDGGEPVWITAYVGHAIDSPQPLDYWRKSMGLKVGGCGMDMGFHVVNSLSYVLYGKGYQCLGKGSCPSNYHVNHHDTIQCEGTMVWNDDGPNTGQRCQWEQGKGWTIDGKPCPKCKGKGRVKNPDGPQRFDLMHTDGYALRHKWL